MDHPQPSIEDLLGEPDRTAVVAALGGRTRGKNPTAGRTDRGRTERENRGRTERG